MCMLKMFHNKKFLKEFFKKDISYIGLGSSNMILFYLNYLFKGPISKYSHIQRYYWSGVWGRLNLAYNSSLLFFRGGCSNGEIYYMFQICQRQSQEDHFLEDGKF